jgi:hypothetical protein
MKNLIFAIALVLQWPLMISAQTIAVGNVFGVPGGTTLPNPVPVIFTNGTGANAVTDFDVVLTFNSALIRIQPSGAAQAACALTGVGVSNSIFIARVGDGNAIPAGPTTICNLTITLLAPFTAGSTPLTISNSGTGGCINGDTSVPCIFISGSVTIADQFTDPTVTFTPAPPGPITLGILGRGSIIANAVGAIGTGSTRVACTPPPGFTISPASVTFNTSLTTQTFALGCTVSGFAQSGNLVCTSTPSSGVAQTSTFALGCVGIVIDYAPTRQLPLLTWAGRTTLLLALLCLGFLVLRFREH